MCLTHDRGTFAGQQIGLAPPMFPVRIPRNMAASAGALLAMPFRTPMVTSSPPQPHRDTLCQEE